MPKVRVKVEARPHGGYWTNTGIHVDNGDQIKIAYSHGTWKSNPHWGPVDGAGDARYPAPGSYMLPDSPEGCVVGKIGGGTGWGDRGKRVFHVGNGAVVPDNPEGILFLTVNDEEQGFGDNVGEIYVDISF